MKEEEEIKIKIQEFMIGKKILQEFSDDTKDLDIIIKTLLWVLK